MIVIIFGENGLPVQEYTVNIGTPLEPDSSLGVRDNAQKMLNLNYKFCKETYEKYYGKLLEYETLKHPDLPEYVVSALA